MWIHEFVRNLIIDNMEDPKALNARSHKHIEHKFAVANKLCATSYC